MSTTPVQGFFAYPSKQDISETIRNAVAKINESNVVHLKSWESCSINGKYIIREICNEIDRCQFFCADLTTLNPNVMFELGFAIARNKRIWIAVDPSVIETKNNLTKLRILTTIGYAEYCNSDDLRTKFFRDTPWIDLNETIFNRGIRPNLPTFIHETIFYLKSRHATEASTVISKEVAKASNAMGISLITDDPRETTVQPLVWYGEQVYIASAVVCHLMNPGREGAELHNRKYSFVAGLAFGLDKQVLMLAHGDFVAPLDYRELLKHYQSASEAERHLHNWLIPIVERFKSESRTKQLYLSSLKLAQQLAQLQIGEPIAENEAIRLVEDYFVETTAYREALDGRQAIFVGRKGAGKSANFLKLASALEADKRNLVCVIKPLSYEMHGIVELLRSYVSMNVKGYAIESIWKFLLYSEIALTAEAAIRARVSEQIFPEEKDLIALLDQNSEMFRPDFSLRLERCVGSLLANSANTKSDSLEGQRHGISEILHGGILRTLREVLSKALGQKQRIAILVDNLDKAWDKQSDIENLTEFLLGLLGATNRVGSDFHNVGSAKRTLNVSLAVFVRADIFYRVMAKAKEPDKILHSKLTWNDDEMLLRVVDERFSSVMNTPPTEVWSKYFCPTIGELPTKSYFLSRILKRPRDILFFVKASIMMAVNRRHVLVEEKDVLDAEKQYSQFAVDSILVENGVSISQLEQVLYEFVGADAVIDESELKAIISASGIDSSKQDYVIKHLCNLTFLGLEVNDNEFRFADDRSEAHRNTVLAQRLVNTNGRPARYRINSAFWAFLEIKS